MKNSNNTINNTVKVLIGNDVPDQGMAWANTFKATGAFAVTRKPNGKHLLDYILESSMPDILIVEAKMEGMDAIPLIRELKRTCGEAPSTIIITADYEMVSIREEAAYLGATFIVKPLDVNTLSDIIGNEDISTPEISNLGTVMTGLGRDQQDLECIVTDIIHQIGIPAHIKGYHFLRYAIMLSVENTEMINCITKLLYPSVAAQFKTTPSRVERAIRHAIELAWDRGDVDVLNSYFGYTIRNSKGKPTNSEFIALISDKLRLQAKTNGYPTKYPLK